MQSRFWVLNLTSILKNQINSIFTALLNIKAAHSDIWHDVGFLFSFSFYFVIHILFIVSVFESCLFPFLSFLIVCFALISLTCV